MATQISLLVGSNALGWAEMGHEAFIGQMTKVMPGGDGSLEWSLYGDAAWKYRNVLVPGAKVRLRVDGDPIWGGRLYNDPIRHRLTTQEQLICTAGGLNAWMTRQQAFAAAFKDNDLAQWKRVRQTYSATEPPTGGELVAMEGQSRFTTDTDGRLYAHAEHEKAYPAYARASFAYWLFDGMDYGYKIQGITASYKCNMPGDWEISFREADTMWDDNTVLVSETANRATWYERDVDLSPAHPAFQIQMRRNNGADGAANEVASDPWMWIRWVKVYFRKPGASVDRTVTIYDGMKDIASLTGFATIVEPSDTTLDVGQTNFMLRPDEQRTAADALREVADRHSGYVEYAFYTTFAGEDAFYCCEKPAVVHPGRNTVWTYGGIPGEDASALERDAETSPDYVCLLYKSDGVATVADGWRRRAWYPSQPANFNANVMLIEDWADVKLVVGDANLFAHRAWDQLQAAQWTGSVPFIDHAMDETGKLKPSWKIRPGDRLKVPSLAGATDLYVAETSFDFQTMTCEANIGPPWSGLMLGKRGDYRRLTHKGHKYGHKARKYHRPKSHKGKWVK